RDEVRAVDGSFAQLDRRADACLGGDALGDRLGILDRREPIDCDGPAVHEPDENFVARLHLASYNRLGRRRRDAVDRGLDVSPCRGDEPYRHLERDAQSLALLAVRRIRHRHRYGPLVPGKRKCAVRLRDVAREKTRDVDVDRELRDVHERLRVLRREQTREIALAKTALDEELAETTSALDRLAEALLDRLERKQSRAKHERAER